MDSAAIARWAEQHVSKPRTHTPAYKRLTDTDRILISRLAAQGISQVAIAQRIGCDQSSVSRWLNACQDSTKEATAYLRGQSLRMARTIVQKGQPKDLVQTLKGVGVLEDQQQQGVIVQVGAGAEVKIGVLVSPQLEPVSPRPDTLPGESVQNP